MPLATNPKATFEVVLDGDRELREDERPAFTYRHLTGLQQIELAEIMDSLENSPSGRNAIERIFEAAAIGLVGWRNVRDEQAAPVSFDAKKLIRIMGFGEAMELARKVFLAQLVSAEDKKKLDSSSESDMEKSVKTAEESKDAPTGPTRQLQ